jgi:hypothetical protein
MLLGRKDSRGRSHPTRTRSPRRRGAVRRETAASSMFVGHVLASFTRSALKWYRFETAGLELEKKGAREEGGSSKKGPIRREAPAANVDEDPSHVPRCIAAYAVRLIDCRVGAERTANRSLASRRAKHPSAASRGDSTGRRRQGDERASSQAADSEENPGRQQTDPSLGRGRE